MKKFMKNLQRICTGRGIAFISILIFTLISCGEDSGLGSSVDTEAPKITILYPPSQAIIKGNFLFYGEWTDDKSVKSVSYSVVYIDSDGNRTEIDSGSATVNSKGSWQVNLNNYDEETYAPYNGWQFCDGNYEISVKAEDNAGHFSDEVPRAFQIDNTAPILVLTNPTTSGSEASPASFGQNVQFTGSFYDLCNKIASLKISFYDSTGKAIGDSTFTNITSMNDSSPLTVARYYSDSEERKTFSQYYGNYVSLVGESNLSEYERGNSIADSQIYFTVTAYDSAKVYADKNDSGTGNGNESTTFYRGTTSMQNLIGGDNETVGDFSLADLAAYLNGTSTAYSSYSATIEEILANAKSISTNTEETPSIDNVTNDDSSVSPVYLTFNVNPMNNPLYQVGGYEVVSESDAAEDADTYSAAGYKRVYAGAPVPVSLTVGADNKNISTGSVSIYRIDTTSYTGKVSAEMFTGETGKSNYTAGYFDLLWTWDSSVVTEFADWGSDVSAVYTATSTDSNVSSLTKQLTVNSFEAGHDYLFYVIGEDISGKELVSTNSYGYGFCGTTSTTAPMISVKEGNKNNSVVNANAFFGSSTASTQSDYLYLSGTISSEEEVNSITISLTLTDSSDSSSTQTKGGNISVQKLETDPDYSSDFKTSYCYTLDSTTSPITYYWRFTTADFSDSFTEFVKTGDYDITIVITADNGATSAIQRTFTLDTQAPVPSLSSVSVSVEVDSNNSDSGYWVNPKKDLTITGLVTDNLSTAKACSTYVKLVALSQADTEVSSASSGEAYTSDTISGVNVWSFTIPASTITPTYYGANLYIYSTDTAGNTGASSTIPLLFDTTAPSGKHIYDKKNKDLIFRVGESNNDADEVSAAKDEQGNSLEWTDSLDKDVGGKYSAGTWGKSQTITIRGDWNEDGSGVALVYYKIYTSEPADSALASFLADYTSLADGKFAPLSETITRRVSYTDSDGNKVFKEIESSFKNTISGFSVGNNYLALVAVDNVGNAGIDTLYATDITNSETDSNITWNKSLASFKLNVDTESPVLVCDKSGQQYTNGVNAITVTGTYSDYPEDSNSEVSSIEIIVNGKSASATLFDGDGNRTTRTTTDGKTEYVWKATIAASTLTSLTSGQSYNANGQITDTAGNTSSSTLFTISFDTESPAVSVTNPSTSSSVNGTISLSGTVSYDGSAPEKLELYCATDVPSEDISSYTKIATITDVAKIYSWTISDIDTYSLTGVADAPKTASLYFIPVVTDGAGNSTVYDLNSSSYKYTSGSNYFKYTVDMDTDRPTVKVTNLTLSDGAYILKYGDNAKIEGMVTDDDATSSAVLKTFVATTSQITDTSSVSLSGKETLTSKVSVSLADGTTGYDTTTFNAATGEWSFTPADTEDGEKTVWFYMIDNADTVFYTGKTATVNGTDYTYLQPYFQYKTSEAEDNSAVLSYKSDSTAPSITNTLIQAYKSDGVTKEGETASPGTSLALGGSEKQYAQFIITGYDANEIEGIRITLSYTDKNSASQTLKIASNSSYDGFAQSGSTEGTTTLTWTTNLIDLSGYATGSVSGTIEVYDKSGLLGTSSPIFMVDNEGPDIGITSPSSTEELTGSITFGGTSTDSGSAGTKASAWLIPTLDQAKYTDEKLTTLADSDGASLWNSTVDATSSAQVWKFTLSTETLAAYDSETYTNSISDGVYTLPFYVMATDELGNYTICRNFTFLHNPDADRPKTEITYPNSNDYQNENDYVTLGGSVRITGSAIIPSATTTVGSVYLQVISGTANGSTNYTQTSDYISGLTYEGNSCYTVSSASDAASTLGLSSLIFATGVDSNSWWGIKANNTSSWNITINSDGEMNPESGEITCIAIRACAINAEGKVGTWTDWYYINIDNTAPTQTATVKQFTNAPSSACTASTILAASNIVASKSYESEMYLRGDWYLTVMLHDESELNSYTVKQGTSTLTEGSGYYASTKVTGSDGKEKTQYLFIPVDKTNASVTYSVTVADTDHTITNTYSLNIDNTAPSIESVYKGSTYNAANVLSETNDNTVADSNYVYTLGGTVDETASGFERLTFYYVRANLIDGKTYNSEAVLDPLITTGTSDAKALISNLTARPLTQGDDTFYLYSKAVEGTLGSDGYTFTATTATDITSNSHIREGGLIEVAGLLRRIESISSGTITFDTSTGVTEETGTTVYFPYAQVVDNTASESVSSSSANPFTFKNNSDDGDGLPETLSGSKSIGYTWDATIHSYNIPDGPCTLVVLAFDKAGNVSGKTFPVKVENSAPRLAKIFLGTDLNANDKWSASEFVGYNLYDANDSYGISTTEVKAEQEIATGNYGSPFIIKNKLAVVAEIVGGNGDIMMVYKNSASSTDAVTSSSGTATGTANSTLPSLVSASTIETVIYNNSEVTTTLKGYTLANYQIVGAENDNAVTNTTDKSEVGASFTFWDSTDELVQGSTSQNCVLYVNDFTIDLVDEVPPKVVVNPFYWSTKSENSLYESSSANGHIELEGDLTGTGVATLYGTDPKVSGKITFTGTTYDDHVLSNISFTYASSSKTYLSGTIATYNASDEKWTVGSGTLSNDGWEATITYTDEESYAGNYYADTTYFAQAGHKVYWTLSIDTEKISDIAATDVTLTVTASDGTNSSASSTASEATTSNGAYTVTDGTTHVPSYQMDIVPYISGMTAASAVSGTSYTKRTNSIRSRRGAVPVQNSDYVVINGFNLSTSFYRQLEANKAAVTTLTDSITGTELTAKESYYISAPTYSGYIIAKTNGIYSLNNMNGDTAYSYESTSTNAYDSEYDGSLDHYFDDRYVWVWRTDYVFADSAQAISPTMEVFPSGGTYYTTATASSKASAGKVYGSWSSDAAMFYSEALGGSRGNPLGTNSWNDSPDDADMCIINGIPFYVILDNWQGSGTQWSKYGLFITRDGNNKGTQTQGNATTVGTSTLEIQGNATSASPYSYDGMDEMMFQFKNPKIAGTYNGGTYYTYACYFDNYAKCLKYGKITWSGTTPTMVVSTMGENSSGKNSHLTDGHTVVDGYDTTVTGYSDYAANVGKYSDIVLDTVNGGSDASPIPVIAYSVIDVSSGDVSLRIARGKSTAPSTTGAVVTSEGTTPTNVTRGWYYTDVTPANSSLIPSGVQLGNYVSMAIDAGGNLHIATQDAEDGDLYYIYLTYSSSADSGYTVAACYKVDSANSVGKWTDIKLESSSGTDSVYGLKCSPVISYLDATNIENKKAIKTAFVASSTNATDGVWEHMTAPATYAANDEKSSLVLSALDSGNTSCKLGIGYQSASFATAFLRGEN